MDNKNLEDIKPSKIQWTKISVKGLDDTTHSINELDKSDILDHDMLSIANMSDIATRPSMPTHMYVPNMQSRTKYSKNE